MDVACSSGTKIYKPGFGADPDGADIGKRVEFKHACGQLGLTRRGVRQGARRRGCPEGVARAVRFLPGSRSGGAQPHGEYCLPLVKVGGNFLAMLARIRRGELAAARGAIKVLGGEYRETRTLHLPGAIPAPSSSAKRFPQTPTAYPRNGGKIAKSPLGQRTSNRNATSPNETSGRAFCFLQPNVSN